MIYAKLKTESVLQENDKTRLDASASFANLGSTIELYEIDPLGDGTFYDVTTDKYLDFVFPLEGNYSPVLRLTDELAATITTTANIEVITAVTDNLFSNDNDLVSHEDDILKWTKEGRDSFLDKHRLAQDIILNDLDKSGIWKRDGERYVAADIVDIQEFADWSKYLVLRLIFESLSNATNDIFHEKSMRYRAEEVQAKKRACLRLDDNGDGETTKHEITTTDMIYGG